MTRAHKKNLYILLWRSTEEVTQKVYVELSPRNRILRGIYICESYHFFYYYYRCCRCAEYIIRICGIFDWIFVPKKSVIFANRRRWWREGWAWCALRPHAVAAAVRVHIPPSPYIFVYAITRMIVLLSIRLTAILYRSYICIYIYICM